MKRLVPSVSFALLAGLPSAYAGPECEAGARGLEMIADTPVFTIVTTDYERPGDVSRVEVNGDTLTFFLNDVAYMTQDSRTSLETAMRADAQRIREESGCVFMGEERVNGELIQVFAPAGRAQDDRIRVSKSNGRVRLIIAHAMETRFYYPP